MKDGMSEDERDLMRRWCQYYVDTETYDRTLPGEFSSRERDSFIPHTEFGSLGKSTRYAVQRARDLFLGTSPEDQACKRYLMRLTFLEQKELLKRLTKAGE